MTYLAQFKTAAGKFLTRNISHSRATLQNIVKYSQNITLVFSIGQIQIVQSPKIQSKFQSQKKIGVKDMKNSVLEQEQVTLNMPQFHINGISFLAKISHSRVIPPICMP